jgi:flagellar basal-body rod modification protein FlgD
VTTVSGTASAPAAKSAGAASTAASSVDYNAFLKLLITQLKNQDPTEPMDTGQFMAQLASFSQVEQGILTNQKLDSLLTASSLAQADGAIGHTVTSPDGSVTGVVESVKITGEGPLATLDTGDTLLLGPGVTVA